MMEAFRIKVCGMRDVSNVEALTQLKPDYLGYIFYRKSSRYVGENPDRRIFTCVPEGMMKVGVFVDEEEEEVLRLTDLYQLHAVQLHGNESPECCRRMRNTGITVFKAISSDVLGDANLMASYDGVVDFFLFDTVSRQYGGSGKKYDWSVLTQLKTSIPWFLSGGISVEDAKEILALDIPGMYGVDINSRFEKHPGVKDLELVSHFIEEIRYEK